MGCGTRVSAGRSRSGCGGAPAIRVVHGCPRRDWGLLDSRAASQRAGWAVGMGRAVAMVGVDWIQGRPADGVMVTRW